MRKRWGDVRAGLWVTVARFALLKLRAHTSDPRNWRPHILVFTGDTRKRIGLVRLASWFNQDRGVVTACQVVPGDLKEEDLNLQQAREQMDRDLKENDLVAFSEVNVVRDFENGIIDIAQANGIANPNQIYAGQKLKIPDLEGRSAEREETSEEPVPEGSRTYLVQSGDTLVDISIAMYGTGSKWREIFEANKHQLESADMVRVGMKLLIP